MRVLLTGAAGFIGGAIRGELHNAGHDAVKWRWLGQHVDDPIAFFDDIDHPGAAECAGIVGLATGGGVEGGAIQLDPAAVIAPPGDAGVERGQPSVGVVEALGHMPVLSRISG